MAKDEFNASGESPPRLMDEAIYRELDHQRAALFRVQAMIRCLGQAFPTAIASADVDVREICNMAFELLDEIAGGIEPDHLQNSRQLTHAAA